MTPSLSRSLLVAILALFLYSSAAAQDDSPAPGIHTDREGARKLPLPDEEDVFHFIIYGDRTGGPPEGIEVLEQAVIDTNLLDPDLVMTVGDLINGYNQTEEWMTQMREFRGVMNDLAMPWYPVAGNHDVYWRGPNRPEREHEGRYEEHFGPLWYWFEHKNAGFVILYTDEGNLETGEMGYGNAALTQMSERQISWLVGALEELEDKDHVFVFLHHPRWIESRYPGSNWPEVHEKLAAAGNVHAVFAGHIHRMRYDGKKDGIEYFSLAATGASIPGVHPDAGWLHHFNVVTVRKDSYSVAALPVGEVMDHRQFTPEREESVDRLRRLAILEPSAIEVGTSGEAAGFWSFALENPVERPIEVVVTTSEDSSWAVSPDHRHVTLEPGQRSSFEFAYSRQADGFTRDLALPRAHIEIDYLEDPYRVRLPPRSLTPNLRLREPSGGFPEASENGVAKLAGENECFRVSSDAFVLPDGPFTLECRVNVRERTSRVGVVAKTENSEFAIFLHDGKPSFDVHLDGSYASAVGSEPLETDRWYDLAGVFDGEEVRLYVDGEVVGRKAAAGHRTPNGLPLFLGADTAGNGRPTSSLIGELDEVRLSRVARYTDDEYEPRERFEPDESTVLLYHLDQRIGPFTIDASATKAHASWNGR